MFTSAGEISSLRGYPHILVPSVLHYDDAAFSAFNTRPSIVELRKFLCYFGNFDATQDFAEPSIAPIHHWHSAYLQLVLSVTPALQRAYAETRLLLPRPRKVNHVTNTL